MCNPIFFCFQLTFHATCFCAYLVGKEKFEHNATPFFERHVLLFRLLLALKNCFSECMCACVTVVITDERRKPAFLSAWYSWTWVLQTSFFLTNICLMISYLEPHPPYIFRIFFFVFFPRGSVGGTILSANLHTVPCIYRGFGCARKEHQVPNNIFDHYLVEETWLLAHVKPRQPATHVRNRLTATCSPRVRSGLHGNGSSVLGRKRKNSEYVHNCCLQAAKINRQIQMWVSKCIYGVLPREVFECTAKYLLPI